MSELHPNAVAHNVHRYRQVKFWSQGELAERMTAQGSLTSTKQVSNIEEGVGQVPVWQLIALAEALQVPVQELLKVRDLPRALVTELTTYLIPELKEYERLKETLPRTASRFRRQFERTQTKEGNLKSVLIGRIVQQEGFDYMLLRRILVDGWTP
jgi:transcriptional regulator with XRE-family HTH domain